MFESIDELSSLFTDAVHNYTLAKKAKTNLEHKMVFEYCKNSLSNIAIASFLISNNEIVWGQEAIKWVKELHVPNGKYPMLIKAVKEIADRSVPLLSSILNHPTSTTNLSLLKDALFEIIENMTAFDAEGRLNDLIRQWREMI